MLNRILPRRQQPYTLRDFMLILQGDHTMQNEDTIQYAKNQSQDHAEFIGEYAKYIYRLGHEHGFKHGHAHALDQRNKGYIRSCTTIAKDMQQEEE